MKGAIGARLQVDRESVGLALAPDDQVDVAAFRQAVAGCRNHGHAQADVCPRCLEPLNAAVELYRDDFLAGFSLRDSAAFDEWQFFEAERLRRELTGALERLVRLLIVEGHLESASEQARRLLTLDPLHEPAHRVMMLLYAWTGQPAAALRQYRECFRVLNEELGVSPLPETTALYEAIKEHRIPPAPSPPSEGSSSTSPQEQFKQTVRTPVDQPAAPLPSHHALAGTQPLHPIPLVGRDAEMASLRQALDRVQADGQVVALVGEPGIGKTRLAEEFLDQLKGSEANTIEARCFEGETTLAYGLFVEALRSAAASPSFAQRLAAVPDRWLTEAGRLLPDLLASRTHLQPAPPLDHPGARIQFFEGIYQTLLALSKDEQARLPSIFFLDNLQWADEASLDVLAYLVRRLRGRPVLLLATWRSEDSDACRRLRQIVQEAERAALGRELMLPLLSPANVQTLVDTVMQAPGDHRRLGEQLFLQSEGLPLFVVEYLATQRLEPMRDATVTPTAGQEEQAWAVPQGVRSLLQARLSAADDTGRQLLAAAAVIGRSFDFDTLRAASGRSEEETIACLEQLVRKGLVREATMNMTGAEPGYDFSHEQLRALVYDETSLARRRLLHRRVAEELARQPRSLHAQDAIAGQIAHHFRMAGHDDEAASYYKLAGEHARSLYANTEALAHFETALALGYPEPAVVHEAIGDLRTLSGSYRQARGDYETAAALADGLKPGEGLARIEHKLASLHHRQGEWELAESHFQAAIESRTPNDQGADLAQLLADRSLNMMRLGQQSEAEELAEEALRLAEVDGDKQALAHAHNALGILARNQGELGLSAEHLSQSLSLAEALNDPAARVAALNNLALVRQAAGETENAIRLTKSALTLCRAHGDRHREAALLNNLADLMHADGQTEEAMAHLKRAVAIFAEIGESESLPQQPEVWKLVEW